MAISKGNRSIKNTAKSKYQNSVDIQTRGPIDIRTVVQNLEDLTTKSTWESLDGNYWLYNGMVVSVVETGKLYILVGFDDTTNFADLPTIKAPGVAAQATEPHWIEIGKDSATKWFTGEGNPANNSHSMGDFYLDTSTSNIYQQNSNGTWTLICNIKGNVPSITINNDGYWTVDGTSTEVKAQGETGESTKWYTGTAVTGTDSNIEGYNAGDLYLNTSTYNVYQATEAEGWVYLCNIKGVPGESPESIPGQDGKSITGITTQYAIGEDLAATPSEWSNTVPDLHPGDYLWCKISIAYENAEIASEDFYVVSSVGGKDGDSVTVSSTQYATSNQGASSENLTWQDTIPTVNPGNYLWVKITFSDGYNYCQVIRYPEDGNSVTVTETEYQLTDTATQPTSGWSTTLPTLQKGKYFWTKTTFSSGDPMYNVTYLGADGVGTNSSITSVTYAKGADGTTTPTSWGSTVPTVNQGEYLWTKIQFNTGDPVYQVTYQPVDGISGENATALSGAVYFNGNISGYKKIGSLVVNNGSSDITRESWDVTLSVSGSYGFYGIYKINRTYVASSTNLLKCNWVVRNGSDLYLKPDFIKVLSNISSQNAGEPIVDTVDIYYKSVSGYPVQYITTQISGIGGKTRYGSIQNNRIILINGYENLESFPETLEEGVLEVTSSDALYVNASNLTFYKGTLSDPQIDGKFELSDNGNLVYSTNNPVTSNDITSAKWNQQITLPSGDTGDSKITLDKTSGILNRKLSGNDWVSDGNDRKFWNTNGGITDTTNWQITDTTYESKPAANGGTDVSLVLTGDKYNWNEKQSKLQTTGSTTTPIYVSSAGTVSECTQYAGGTKLTLNGQSKSGQASSIYAPTSAGFQEQVLMSNGTNNTPTWTDNYARNKTLSAQVDLNDVIIPGFYNYSNTDAFVGDPTQLQNYPTAFQNSGSTSFGLEVIHSASGAYYTQIMYSSTGTIYKRKCSNNTWGEWVTVYLTDTKVTSVDDHYKTSGYTAATSGLYKITTDAAGHVIAQTAVTKNDITGLGIPGSDTNTDTKQTISSSTDTMYLTGITSTPSNNAVTGVANTKVYATDGTLHSSKLEVGSGLAIGTNSVAEGANYYADITSLLWYGENNAGPYFKEEGSNEGEFIYGLYLTSITFNIDSGDTPVTKQITPEMYVSTSNPITSNSYAKIKTISYVDSTKYKLTLSYDFGSDPSSLYIISGSAFGNNSHVEGYHCIATGKQAHAEGAFTLASGRNSHAEGRNSNSTQSNAHAEGELTLASGNCAHAEGYNTVASGNYSHAEGYKTVAASSYQSVRGKYNETDYDSKYIDIVGWGDNEQGVNIYTLDTFGNGRFVGNIGNGSTTINSGPVTINAKSKKYIWVNNVNGADILSSSNGVAPTLNIGITSTVDSDDQFVKEVIVRIYNNYTPESVGYPNSINIKLTQGSGVTLTNMYNSALTGNGLVLEHGKTLELVFTFWRYNDVTFNGGISV